MRHIFYLIYCHEKEKLKSCHPGTARIPAPTVGRRLGTKIREPVHLRGKVQTHYCSEKCNLTQRSGVPTLQARKPKQNYGSQHRLGRRRAGEGADGYSPAGSCRAPKGVLTAGISTRWLPACSPHHPTWKKLPSGNDRGCE